MSELIDRALALWDGNAAAQEDAVDRFREVYADPLTVNGALVPLSGMVDRARSMGEAFTDRRTVVHEVVEGDGTLAFAFEIQARHTGPWPTHDGSTVEPTGHPIVVQGLDIFRLDDTGRVAVIWALNDVDLALTRTP
jgi:SnoaL-like polyketide cyclase